MPHTSLFPFPELPSYVPSQLWSLLERAADGVWYWDSGADRVTWSPRLLQLLGVADGTALSIADIDDLTHPDDRAPYRAALEASRGDGSAYRAEIRLRHSDGHYLRVAANGIWLPSADGPDGSSLLGFILDQSRLYEARESRARSEARLRSFLEHCPAGVFIKDASGRHLYGNPVAAGIVGIAREQYAGTTLEDLFDPDTARELARIDHEVLAACARRTWTGEVVAGGRTRHVVDMKFPVEDPDTGERLIGGFVMDLTELRRAKQRLESAQRLESLGLLAGGVAHDFNNLLVGIRGSAELLRERIPADALPLLETIVHSAGHASDLCAHLLSTAAARAPQPEAVPIAEFLLSTRELLAIAVRGRGEITTSVADALPPCRVDPAQLRQVLMNLVINAVEAGVRGRARILLSCDGVAAAPPLGDGVERDFRVPDDGGRGLIRIRIEDDGPGIPAHLLHNLFDPFFTTKDTGKGLGLSSVLAAVEANRGLIRLCSAPGAGARFDVYLPVAEGVAEPAAPAAAPAGPERAASAPGDATRGQSTPQAGHALVVDDDVSVRDVVRWMLEHAGFSVEVRDGGAAALERLRTPGPEFDLIVLDMSMPGMDGRETLAALRGAGHGVPVLLSSGFSEQEVAVGDDPACRFLHKPFGRREFMQAVEGLLGPRRPAAAQP